MQSKGKTKGPARRVRQKSAQGTRETKEGNSRGKDDPQPALSVQSGSNASGSKGLQVKNADKLIASGNSLLSGFKQVSPMCLWQNPQKAKDMDQKFTKAMDLCTKLNTIPHNESAVKLAEELAQLAEKLSTWVEVVIGLKRPEPGTSGFGAMINRVGSTAKEVGKTLGVQSTDCQRNVLIDIGRVLAEAGVKFSWDRQCLPV